MGRNEVSSFFFFFLYNYYHNIAGIYRGGGGDKISVDDKNFVIHKLTLSALY